MAIGWLAVLKMVPWRDVISNAPAVADGAKKLWKAVGKKSPASSTHSVNATPRIVTESQAVMLLQAQVTSLEALTADLHSQMLASSELINALAEQNAQLVKRVEVNRTRVLWLAAITAVLAIVVFSKLV
jgi:hypothetical protein